MGRSIEVAAKAVAYDKFYDYLTWNNQGGADWYVRAHTDIIAKWGAHQVDLMCDLIAATSPQATVVQNIKLAEDAYYNYEDGNWKPWIRSHRKNVERAFKREPLSGPKVRAFAAALKGDRDATVVDTWMLKAAGYRGKALKHKRSFKVTERAIQIAAAAVGMKNTEAQATIWMAYRKEFWEAKAGPGDGYLPVAGSK